jgi:molybdenum cofactor cytidylyltransferase
VSGKIAAIILAAGLSSRLPEGKLLLPFGGKPLVRHAADAALASRASPVIAVTGHEAERVSSALASPKIQIVENRDYATGLSSSLKCGLRAVPAACEGVVILLGDMPYVTTALIDALVDAFDHGREIVVPVRQGRRGNPVLWGRRFFPELLALTGDQGAKHLMALHADVLYQLEALDDGVLIDIDRVENLN